MTIDTSNILQVNIEDTMRTAYMEYAMSVIVGRALPDVRDGLKPVHRRILYAMHSMNCVHNRPYMKSARIVGEVIGKYHPHGDSAVYDATVRMVQEFSMRNPLVDGQGNFGSVDGDSAAAMRYTEIRLQKISQELLEDLDKNTVDFIDNYDGSLQEPSVLPTKVPTLLINGSTGIAVGMATNIPPHNLKEVIAGLLFYIDNRVTCTLEDLLPLIHGPDFPTAGLIMGREGIYSAYRTGRGIIKIRAKTQVEPILKSNSREAIIVTELPYMVNKARLIEKIAELVKNKRIEGIQDLRDESDRQGMRIVIELRRNEIPETVLANLFKYTSMQSSFGTIMLAVVDGQPKVLPLLSVLKLFISHRIDVVVRRTRFELKKAEERAHILQGLKIALDNIDAVVQLVRSSASGKVAKERLGEEFALSAVQAQAILDMRLQRLTALEVDKLVFELDGLLEKIKDHQEILGDEQKVLDIIKEELVQISETYGSERRSEIVNYSEDITDEDLIPVEEMAVTMSRKGYIKRCTVDTYQAQHRGGKGKMGMKTQDEDALEHIFVASTHDTLLIFTNHGKVYWKKVYELPLAGRIARGRAWVNILPLADDEKVVFCTPISEYSDDTFITMITRKGIIKKTALTAYQNRRTKGTKAILIDEDDSLITVRLCRDEDLIFIATRNGMALKFPSQSLRTQGRVTRGCKGIRLKTDDQGNVDRVISMEIVSEDGVILTVTENGFGKKTLASQYRQGSRGNMGVLNIRNSERNGAIVGSILVNEEDELMLITGKGKIIRLPSGQIRQTTRVTQGVSLIRLDEDEKVVSMAKIVPDEDNDKDNGEDSTEVNGEDNTEGNTEVKVEDNTEGNTEVKVEDNTEGNTEETGEDNTEAAE
ncbi:MAG: DNA gyrase subunit A [SAR324 cluster bacterium]|uniref:DNA gyrase subunit A n=1 Tax=SAR324 cluster bacterium TaxID=2024889 RepID=A0A2A4T9T6_9DELT|nr:MAG: DNA gyrase subunit A [SAR324 cluster bacterium]